MREAGTNAYAGGKRNFFSAWDYFSPTADGMNRVDDILAVVHQYLIDKGDPGHTASTDRSAFGPNSWNLGRPDGQQHLDDILAAIGSYFHDSS